MRRDYYPEKELNKNDDAPDVLAAIYKRAALPSKYVFRIRSADFADSLLAAWWCKTYRPRIGSR
jgi:hypothetical protein